MTHLHTDRKIDTLVKDGSHLGAELQRVLHKLLEPGAAGILAFFDLVLFKKPPDECGLAQAIVTHQQQVQVNVCTTHSQ